MRDRVLRERQRLAGGDAQLPLDQVEAGDHLGHRVLDLQAGVHLQEVEVRRRVDDELDRAGADVADRARGRDRGRAHARRGVASVRPGAGASSMTFWWRRWTEQSRSNRCTHVAVRVGEDLDLDVARALEVASRSARGRRRRRTAASRRAAGERGGELARRVRPMRMPLPPPPALALISTGKPMRAASSASVAASWSSP